MQANFIKKDSGLDTILSLLLFFAENELISIFFAEKEIIFKQELLHTPEF